MLSLMRTKPSVPAVVATFAIAALLAGCGGGGSSSTPTSDAVAGSGDGGAAGAGESAMPDGDGSAGKGGGPGGEGGGSPGNGASGNGSNGSGTGNDRSGGSGGGKGGSLGNAQGQRGKGNKGKSGGGSGGGSGASGTGAKAAFIKEADGICSKQIVQIQQGVQSALQGGLNGLAQKGVPGKLVNQIIAPGLEATIGEVRALSTPAGTRGEVEAVLTAIQESVDGARANPKAFLTQGNALAKSEQLARQFGFSVCGGSG
jgi:hypothetical protein